jgi:uncharacterized protein with ATP-grasp and redox domains
MLDLREEQEDTIVDSIHNKALVRIGANGIGNFDVLRDYGRRNVFYLFDQPCAKAPPTHRILPGRAEHSTI